MPVVRNDEANSQRSPSSAQAECSATGVTPWQCVARLKNAQDRLGDKWWHRSISELSLILSESLSTKGIGEASRSLPRYCPWGPTARPVFSVSVHPCKYRT